MTRIKKDVVDYFPHDADASEGDTLTVLQSRFGNNGYAFWFKLLEKLASSEGHYLDCGNPTKWQLLLAKTGVDNITGVEIVKLLVEMQAIDKELWESKVIWCQNLVNNVADVYRNRRRDIPQKPLTTGDKAITTKDKGITTSGKPQSKVKESKVKESREDIHQKGKGSATTFEGYKEELKAEFEDLDVEEEYKKFKLWWGEGRKPLKRPKLAFRNWLVKARQIKKEREDGTYKQRAGKPTTQYTDPEELRHEVEFDE